MLISLDLARLAQLPQYHNEDFLLFSSEFQLLFCPAFSEAYCKANMHPVESVFSLRLWCVVMCGVAYKATTRAGVRCMTPFLPTSNLEAL